MVAAVVFSKAILLILFVWFHYLSPINNFSVIKERVFPGWTSTKLGLMFLLKDTTQWRRWDSNPRPSGLEWSTLALSAHDSVDCSLFYCCFDYVWGSCFWSWSQFVIQLVVSSCFICQSYLSSLRCHGMVCGLWLHGTSHFCVVNITIKHFTSFSHFYYIKTISCNSLVIKHSTFDFKPLMCSPISCKDVPHPNKNILFHYFCIS